MDESCLLAPLDEYNEDDSKGISKIPPQTSRYSSHIIQMLERVENKINAEEYQKKFGFDNLFEGIITTAPTSKSAISTAKNDLWVDKYRPKKFTQLITMDSCNLEVLRWVNQWEFAKELVSGAPKSEVLRKIDDHRKKNLRNRNPLSTSKQNTHSSSQDFLERPERKIMLVHGHPGLGKTTLAHVIAQTAGYSVIEINASDERMGNSVITKISSALDVKTSFTSDRKPAMIIIDEIDGAAAAGNENNLIKYLVKIATAKTSYNNKRSRNNSKEKTNIKDDDGSETDDENVFFSDYKDKKSRSVSDLGLLHPIICICNDLYVPALRPLRQVAHILQVKPVGPVQLSLRLKSICDREGLKINTRTLVDLAEVMDSDVRSTLNALQFLHRKSLSGSASNFNRDLTFGAFKDTVKPPMKLYESIFLNSTNSNSLKKSNISSGAGRKHSDLLDMVWGSGIEMDKLMGGCFELYPTVKFFDNTAMDRVNAALELFSSFDLMGGNFKNSSGKFDGYLSYKFVGLKDLFSSPVYSPLKYPREDYENFQKISESKAIFKDYLSGLSGKLRSESGIKDSLLLDRIPAILNSSLANFPVIKSSNPKLMKPEEHTLIRKTVEILLSEGVQLRQIKIPDSTAYKFVIDPPIDRLIIHKDDDFYKTLYDYESPQDSHTYSLCRLVAAEMEALRIRRQKSKQSENITEASTTSPSAMTQQPYSIKRKIAEQVLKDPRDLKKRVARDFFGRPIAVDENEESISKNTSGSSTSVNESKMLLWYTQNDGVSNAVRRDIKVGSFLS